MNESREEEAVVEALKHFQPRPSQKAHKRMSSTPWMLNKETGLRTNSLSRPFQVAATVVFIMLSVVIVVSVTPPLRSLAQDIIDTLFNRTKSDNRVVEYRVEPTPVNTISPSIAQTFYSVDEAERVTGIDIFQPTIDLSPYSLTGVSVNHQTETVWLTYNTSGRYLSIYQRPSALGWLDEGFVGASAEVATVHFENAVGITITAEYVVGGWKPLAEPTPINDQTVEQPQEWSSESVQRKLRWRDEHFVYEMVAFGGKGDIPRRDLLLDDMIAIAASMK